MSKRLGLTIGTILLMSYLLIFRCLSDGGYVAIVSLVLGYYFGNRAYTEKGVKDDKKTGDTIGS